MEKIKTKKIIIPIIFVLGLLLGYFIFKDTGSREESKSVLDNYSKTSLSEASSVSCIFEKTLMVSYNGSAIEYGVLHKESSPLSFSFNGIDSSNPTLSANGTAGTTYQSDLKILSDTEEKVVLSEVTPTDGNVFIYTIYKKDGVAIWTKQYSLMGIPAGIMSMGKCSVIANKIVKDETKINTQEENKVEELKAFIEAKKERELGATKADEYLADTQNTTNEVNATQNNVNEINTPKVSTSEKIWTTVMKDSGSTNKTSKMFSVKSEKFKVIWDYAGDNNFIVKAVNPDDNILGGCLIANVMGTASAYTTCGKGPGTFYIHVINASGPWSIEVQE